MPQKPLPGTIRAIKQYNLKEIFKQSVLFFLSDMRENQELMEHNKLMFEKMDVNRDGKLSKKEIVTKLISHLAGWSGSYAEKLFDKADVDGSGELSYNEFIAYALDEECLNSKKVLKKAF